MKRCDQEKQRGGGVGIESVPSSPSPSLPSFSPISATLHYLYVSGKLPAYSSPKPSFCRNREVPVYVGLGEG